MSDVIRVRDYPRATGETHDGPRIMRAVNAYTAGLRNGTAGVLDFGTGNYDTGGQHLLIAQPSNAPLFGRIVGDGPDICTLRGYPNVRTMTVMNANCMEIGGIKFSGGPAACPPMVWTVGQDHIGLTLSNVGGGVAHGNRVHDCRFENYAIGFALGDWNTAGAAAECHMDSIGASRCTFGISGFSFNTLNNTFTNTELGECMSGVYSDSAYGWAFYGGSLGNNRHSFEFRCGGEVIIQNFRDEFGPLTAVDGGFISYGASTSIRLNVSGCQVLDQEPMRSQRWITRCITPTAGQTGLIVTSSLLSGQVAASKYLRLEDVGFITQQAQGWSGTPTAYFVAGTYKLDKMSGQTIADFPSVSSLSGSGGTVGPTGPAGPAGPKGTTGATGATGPAGLVGPVGPASADGATGPQGPQGTQGPAGPAGPQGPAGEHYTPTWHVPATTSVYASAFTSPRLPECVFDSDPATFWRIEGTATGWVAGEFGGQLVAGMQADVYTWTTSPVTVTASAYSVDAWREVGRKTLALPLNTWTQVQVDFPATWTAGIRLDITEPGAWPTVREVRIYAEP
jgi:hypothetical protein